MVGRQLHVPVRAEDQDVAVGQLCCQEAEQQHRRCVGGVHVLEQQDQRHPRRPRSEERCGRVELPEPGGLGVEGRGFADVADELAHLGQHLREVPGHGGNLGSHRVRLLRSEVGPEDLHPRPVGRGAARLPAPPGQNPGAGVPRPGQELVREPALADARLTGQQVEPSSSRNRFVQAGLKGGELSFATDEDALGKALVFHRRVCTPRDGVGPWQPGDETEARRDEDPGRGLSSGSPR